MAVQEGTRARALDLQRGRLDFSVLGGLAAAYQEGREIRITAKRDLSTGAFVSEYEPGQPAGRRRGDERKSVVTSGPNAHHVWARTGAYPTCRGDEVEACLEAAIQEVSRLPVR